jgi:hypothetical protein
MKMAFEWNRMYKWEENHERNISEDVDEYICEYYDVESIEDLTKEQIDEIEVFRSELNEYNIMQIGFSNVINNWEHAQDE